MLSSCKTDFACPPPGVVDGRSVWADTGIAGAIVAELVGMGLRCVGYMVIFHCFPALKRQNMDM